MRCPACLAIVGDSYEDLAFHMIERSGKSDADHVMFLNRNISMRRIDAANLSALLEKYFSCNEGIKRWIIDKFISIFFGQPAHPFVEAHQHPSKYLMLGYAWEHHHFLRQWVRSCAYIMAKTDVDDVVDYEIENIDSEWGGRGSGFPSHHELLLRMAESYGMGREIILSSKPLKETNEAIEVWNKIARDFTWQEGVAAMHTLELIANKNVVKYGSRKTYFDPEILSGNEITDEAKHFLKEGYEADVSHSERALDLLEKNCHDALIQHCQAVAIKSMSVFDRYLMARIKRGDMIENEQY
ncbi:MAG: C2H2 type zinc finger domain-containing protein [Thermoplasmataceae archaeon]